MPHYDYECQNKSCNHKFELFQNMTAEVEVTCPKCKKDTLVRLIGPGAGVIFKKGSGGFYCKDYPKGEPNDRSES